MDEMEERWALETPERRQQIERKAIMLKHHVDLEEIPLRAAPAHLIGPLPLTFAQLESLYFNIPERSFVDFVDLANKRTQWLAALNLNDSLYHEMCITPEQSVVVESIYSNKPIFERRAVEAKAKYLRVMLNPPVPSWQALEGAYEINPRTGFTLHKMYTEKRAEWLKLLGIYMKPFWSAKLSESEDEKEAKEVAWSEIEESKRQDVEQKARKLKSESNPILQSWAELESTFCYASDIDRKFKNDPGGYSYFRKSWLQAIGVDVSPYNDPIADEFAIEMDWKSKSIAQKKPIVDKAKAEKERWLRDQARRKIEKAESNYKAPEKAAEKSASKSLEKGHSDKLPFYGERSSSRIYKSSSLKPIPKKNSSNYNGSRRPQDGSVTGVWLHAADGRRIRRAG